MPALKKDVNLMTPVGKLGYVDVRPVLTGVSATAKDAEKLVGIEISKMGGGPWRLVEQHNELVDQVSIGEYQGPGWVVTAVFVREGRHG